MANLNNGAYSTLASGITAGATSLSVASGDGARFPSSNFYISVYDSRYPNWAVAYRAGAGEIMLCSSRSTDALTVTRAQGGTSAVAFNTTGVTYRVENNLVAENLSGLSSDYVALTGDQSVAGVKTFTESVKIGVASSVTGALVLLTEANANTGSFIADAGGYSGTRTWTGPDASGTVALTNQLKQLLTFGYTTTINSNTTAFIPVGVNSAVSTGTQRFYFSVAGTLSNLTCWGGISSSLSAVFTIMRGVGTGASSATAITATVTPAVNGTYESFSDTTHSISIAAGDWIELRIANSASGFGITGVGASVEFIPS